MAVVALGLDLVQIDRLAEMLERRGDRLLERLFTDAERAYCDRRKRRATHYAGRFAVKEAVMKALGTGWAQGVRWRDIEVVRQPGRAPELALHGASARIARESSEKATRPTARIGRLFRNSRHWWSVRSIGAAPPEPSSAGSQPAESPRRQARLSRQASVAARPRMGTALR